MTGKTSSLERLLAPGQRNGTVFSGSWSRWSPALVPCSPEPGAGGHQCSGPSLPQLSELVRVTIERATCKATLLAGGFCTAFLSHYPHHFDYDSSGNVVHKVYTKHHQIEMEEVNMHKQ
jgi:hypothetical protein